MTPLLGIFLICCAIVVGYLYWDKLKEIKMYERLLVEGEAAIREKNAGLGIFVLHTKEEMAADLDDMIQELGQRDVNLGRRKEYKWGFEVSLDTGYKIFLCDPRIEIPELPISTVFIDEHMNADLTIQTLLKHEGQIAEVHLWIEEPV